MVTPPSDGPPAVQQNRSDALVDLREAADRDACCLPGRWRPAHARGAPPPGSGGEQFGLGVGDGGGEAADLVEGEPVCDLVDETLVEEAHQLAVFEAVG